MVRVGKCVNLARIPQIDNTRRINNPVGFRLAIATSGESATSGPSDAHVRMAGIYIVSLFDWIERRFSCLSAVQALRAIRL
jgi:hypothetical protein